MKRCDTSPDTWWAADVIPLLTPQAEDPLARFAVVIVMTDDVVIHTQYVRHPGGDRAAGLVVAALRSAAYETGVWPDHLAIRGEVLADAVDEALDEIGSGIPTINVTGVTRFRDMPAPAGEAVDAAILDLRRHMDGAQIPDAPTAASPTWMAWGVAPELIADFFHATAGLYRAAAARRFLEDGVLLRLERVGYEESAITLYGEDDRLESATLFLDALDWGAMVESGRGDPARADVRHPVSHITFVPAEVLGAEMTQEVATHGWEVATPEAYPTLWIMNADGGGLTTAYFTEIIEQLSAVSRALPAAPGPLHAESVFRHVDRETGITVRTALDLDE